MLRRSIKYIFKTQSLAHLVSETTRHSPVCSIIAPQNTPVHRMRWISSSRPVCSSIQDLSLSSDERNLQIRWSNGKISNFYSMWLRFNCQCSECHEHESNMTRYRVEKIPMEMKITKATQTDSGKIRLQWDLEDHVTEFDLEFLERNCYSNQSLHEKRENTKPDINAKTTVSDISFEEVHSSETGLYKWLRTINEEGLCLLRGVPTDDGYIKKVIELIGPIQNTLYGEIHDVKVEENPINVAYTNEALAFHMDLQQYESPPGIQFLHSLQFDDSIHGGETTFVDLFAVAQQFRQSYPDDFRTLCTVPATFQRIHRSRDNPVKMIYRKSHVQLNDREEIIGINWHPNLHGPLAVEEKYVEKYYKAYQLFAKEICSGQFTKEVRLNPGDLIAYNNRRMCHGRNAFEKNGRRHLQGGYLNIDDYKSKLMALAESLGDSRPVKRVFNNDWF